MTPRGPAGPVHRPLRSSADLPWRRSEPPAGDRACSQAQNPGRDARRSVRAPDAVRTRRGRARTHQPAARRRHAAPAAAGIPPRGSAAAPPARARAVAARLRAVPSRRRAAPASSIAARLAASARRSSSCVAGGPPPAALPRPPLPARAAAVRLRRPARTPVGGAAVRQDAGRFQLREHVRDQRAGRSAGAPRRSRRPAPRRR